MINEIKAVIEKHKENIPVVAVAELLAVLDGAEKKAEKEKEALKKRQIAKPIDTPPCNVCASDWCEEKCEHFGNEYINNYRCPTCGSGMVYIEEYDIRHSHCPNCGQKLSW